MNSLTDEQLISEYKKYDDNECVGILFKRYTHLVFGVCMKYLKNEENARDASMEIFETLFEKLKTHEIMYFNGWIYSVSKNACLMALRKDKKLFVSSETIFEKVQDENVEFDFLLHPNHESQNGLLKRLENALINLKMEQQNCIKLMYIENRSYKEISVITGYPLKKVKSCIQNGKRKLKIFLEEK